MRRCYTRTLPISCQSGEVEVDYDIDDVLDMIEDLTHADTLAVRSMFEDVCQPPPPSMEDVCKRELLDKALNQLSLSQLEGIILPHLK